ncbi:MAG: hypothetical protein RI993_1081 [Pseudomonadota bacterium]|jgi:two-component system chemotaxis sensor kinase CheA
MSADLEQFYQIFFEEASELLAEMETRLLGLDVQSPDPEDLNAIFRVAHSIKGGAGTFGFADMTEMTHMLESLLDKLRKGELTLRSEMVDAFLQASDVLKQQLNGHSGEGQVNSAEAMVASQKLKELMTATAVNEATLLSAVIELNKAPEYSLHETPATQAIPPTNSNAPEEASANIPITYRIHFSCQNLSDVVMTKLLADLARQGSLENLSAPQQQDICCLKLTTMESEEDIWEALAFIVDPVTLVIEAEVTAQAPADNISPAADKPAVMMDAPPAESVKTPAEPARPKAAASSESSSIRVSIEKVDQMINLVGELVITQAMLAQTASQIDPVIHEKLLNGLNQLERNTRDLQESVMSIRMMPISFVFSRFPRVVRDVAAKLGKKVELKTIGEGTELDKGLIEKITDPLTHLIRNSLDHGIESPEKRVALGKPAQGTITLRASHQGGSIVIEVMDDGAGLNAEKILAKARERGLPISETITDQEIWMLIFEAGFSTAEVITDVSGRGVGMDVVKRNIQALGGRVEINSTLGQGTKISIRLPLTLAILDGLSVSVGDQLFIVPLTYITESLKPQAADIRTVRGQGRVVQVRGEYLPVIALHEVLGLQPAAAQIHEGILVILDAEGCKAAMFVDALIGQHQVVIKSLESNYRRVQGVSGATIMGDGSVALILDAAALVSMIKQSQADAA